MSRYSREEALLIAAEKVKRKAEKEQREEDEFYGRITSGTQWLLFKIVVGFCTLMVVLTTIDVLVDGETKDLDESEWAIDRELYMIAHQSITVDGALFVAPFKNWRGHVDNSFAMTYSPIFGTPKKMSYDQDLSGVGTMRQETIRRRSIFTWFPYFQIVMLIPLLTFFYKRQKPLFNFARVMSLIIVLPGILLVLFITLL